MTRTTTTTLLILLALAPEVRAEGHSQREVSYAEHLGAALGGEARLVRLRLVWTPSADGLAGVLDLDVPFATAAWRARGVRVMLPGLVIDRLRFEDAAGAREFAGRAEVGQASQGPVAGELRGDQVVFVVGERVRDGAFARRALDLAWEVLPVTAPREATFANLGGAELAAMTTAAVGPLATAIDHVDRAARTAEEDGGTDVAVTRRGAHELEVRLAGGLTLAVHVGADRRWVWSTSDPARAAAMPRYLAALVGQPARGQGLVDRLPTGRGEARPGAAGR